MRFIAIFFIAFVVSLNSVIVFAQQTTEMTIKFSDNETAHIAIEIKKP